MSPARAPHRRPIARLWAIAAVLGLVATACGTRVDEAVLRASSGAFATDGGGGGFADGTGSGDGALGGTSGVPVSEGGSVSGGGTGSSGGGGGSSGGGGGGGGTSSEILLGSFGTYSGLVGAVFKSMPPAARAWAAEVNENGGLNGHPVRIIFEDTGGDPGRALAIARRMVEERKVLAFFGLAVAGEIVSVTPYLEDKRVPVIGGSTHIDSGRSYVYFNPQVDTFGTYRSYIGTMVTLTKARKFAFLYCRESASCAASRDELREYAPKLGVEIVYEAQVSAVQPDYTGEMIAARNAGAEAVGFSLDVPSTVRAIRSARRQGWNPVFAGSIAQYEIAFPEAGEEVEGALAAGSVAPFSISPRMKPYRDAVAQHVPGGQLGDWGAQVWAGGKLFEAIAPRLSDRPGRPEVFDALWSLRDETLGGIVPPLTFPRGAHTKINLCTVPLRVQGGKFVAPLGDTFVCATDGGLKRFSP